MQIVGKQRIYLLVVLVRGPEHVKCQVSQLCAIHVHVYDSGDARGKRNLLRNDDKHRKRPEKKECF